MCETFDIDIEWICLSSELNGVFNRSDKYHFINSFVNIQKYEIVPDQTKMIQILLLHCYVFNGRNICSLF